MVITDWVTIVTGYHGLLGYLDYLLSIHGYLLGYHSYLLSYHSYLHFHLFHVYAPWICDHAYDWLNNSQYKKEPFR